MFSTWTNLADAARSLGLAATGWNRKAYGEGHAGVLMLAGKANDEVAIAGKSAPRMIVDNATSDRTPEDAPPPQPPTAPDSNTAQLPQSQQAALMRAWCSFGNSARSAAP